MTESRERPRGLDPALRIEGELCPPRSKSLAIRSLLAAGLARGETTIEGLSAAEDVLAALRVLERCGVASRPHGTDALVVTGTPPGPPDAWVASEPVDCGESGTLARLVTAVLALCPAPGSRSVVTARGTLLRRFTRPLLAALERSGAAVSPHGVAASWPVTLVSAAPRSPLLLEDPCSSQELSGLLLALAATGGGEVQVRGELPSRPYARMTAEVLGDFGVGAREHDEGVWRVEGLLRASRAPVVIEPDASAAAVALAAGCLSGGEVRIGGWSGERSRQGDVAIAAHLRAFGCDASFSGGVLRASGPPRHGATLDLAGEPDLAPVLVAVAAAVALERPGAAGTTTLTGLETLNAKECRRVDVLARGLRAVGLAVETGERGAWMRITPGDGAAPEGVLLDPDGDHRMAFSFALLGLARAGVRVASPGCVAKSWPDFWEALGG